MAEKKQAPAIITDPSVGTVMRMSVDEYKEWSKSQGRIMGRLPNQKTYPTEEEMRVLVNTGYTRAMVKEKHGLDDKEVDALLTKMSYKEGRDRVITLH